ncbi:MAG: S8 family serine peptidase [Deltaproteobacteria bacterium]|nr:S8 family serine peptidase [Deltaproteobacteria bacterium]
MDFSQRMWSSLCFLILTSLFTVSCTQQKPNLNLFGPDLKRASQIFSDRPQQKGDVVLLLKLSQPALLSALKIDRLKNVVDKELSRAIQAEQAAVIAKLKEINPEILILYRYKMVLNALTIVAPEKDLEKIQGVTGVNLVQRSQSFERAKAVMPATAATLATAATAEVASSVISLNLNNSALFLGAKTAYDKNIKGQNIRVGIIDTGIDYTHAMLGGSGNIDDYSKVSPDKESSQFPNRKVVGGLDFVGTQFNAASDVFSQRIPKMDGNPMDEGGHGSHVAGTVAGIGDGSNSYNGVAPSALLYALKVFGAEGSTSDEVVIAALEYAADPDGDEVLDDRLDVVNLSLGSNYGGPKIFYNQAIRNLTLGGTVVVCSAGNSGDTSYIVGAPSVSDEAISVAASVDSMEHNWKFKAISIQFNDKSETVVEAVESSMSKPLAHLESTQGNFMYVGSLNKDLTEEEKALLHEKVALVDRGESTFSEKIHRAEQAGAVGVVVVNNQDGEPFSMGGTGKFDIPAIMVSKKLGLRIKEALKAGPVSINFKLDKLLEKTNLIDTITDFSSRGPRSEDALIKPEIAAPGANIISAAMGKGKETVKFSGTSMSGPHIAGVMALMKQYYPELSVAELKSVVMGTAKSMVDADGKPYSISRVGAGRVQIDQALSATLASATSALSLGDVRIDSQKMLLKNLNLKNIKPEPIKVTAVFEGNPALTMEPQEISLDPRAEVAVSLKFTLLASLLKKSATGNSATVNSATELDGYVKFYKDKEKDKTEVFRLPLLAVVRKISGISANSLMIQSTSQVDSDGALAELSLSNLSGQKGITYPMNLIMTDDRKKDPTQDEFKSKACDLQSVGYKVVGDKLYVGFKLYQQVTSWNLCELNMQIDSDRDGVPDQEIVGVPMSRLEGLPASGKFVTLNLDASMIRNLRTAFEKQNDKSKESESPKRPNYLKAVNDVQEMIYYDHSSIAMLIVDMNKIKRDPTGEVFVKLATSSLEEYAIEGDDYLGNDQNQWRKMDLSAKGQSFIFDQLSLELEGHQNKVLSFTKGQGFGELILLTPTNRSVLNVLSSDDQLEIVKARYMN